MKFHVCWNSSHNLGCRSPETIRVLNEVVCNDKHNPGFKSVENFMGWEVVLIRLRPEREQLTIDAVVNVKSYFEIARYGHCDYLFS